VSMPDPVRASFNAAQYWNQFPITAYFDQPGVTVSGHLIEHLTVKTADGPMPKLRLQTDKGRIVYVNVSQARLLSELVRLAPAVGDQVTITYHGEANKAARGMNPAKEFSVEIVRRQKPAEQAAQ